MGCLAELRNLKTLYLSVGQISDAGLAHLVSLTNLEFPYLSVAGARTSDAVWFMLKNWPTCGIFTLAARSLPTRASPNCKKCCQTATAPERSRTQICPKSVDYQYVPFSPGKA